MMKLQNTEEAFVLATVKEFVKFWGSENQAHPSLECKNWNAWVHLAFQVGRPSAQHFDPQPLPSPHLNLHPSAPTKHKGPSRREKDRARAAAHRDRLLKLEENHTTPSHFLN